MEDRSRSNNAEMVKSIWAVSTNSSSTNSSFNYLYELEQIRTNSGWVPGGDYTHYPSTNITGTYSTLMGLTNGITGLADRLWGMPTNVYEADHPLWRFQMITNIGGGLVTVDFDPRKSFLAPYVWFFRMLIASAFAIMWFLEIVAQMRDEWSSLGKITSAVVSGAARVILNMLTGGFWLAAVGGVVYAIASGSAFNYIMNQIHLPWDTALWDSVPLLIRQIVAETLSLCLWLFPIEALLKMWFIKTIIEWQMKGMVGLAGVVLRFLL